MKVQLQLFLCFFKLGFIAFGGGYSMIPLVEREIVGKLQLMDQQTFTDIVSISGGLPGAVGLNVAIFIGYTTGGILGAIVGAIASVLPCLIIIFTLMTLFSNISDLPAVQKAMDGIRPVVVALIAYASYRIGKTAYQAPPYIILTIISLALCLLLPSLPLPAVVAMGIVAGLAITFARRRLWH